MGRLFCVLVAGSVIAAACTLDAAEIAVQAGTTRAGGVLAADESWTAAGSPYRLTGDLTIPDRRTLTIEPGVTVYLTSGVDITVADGGRILAGGTESQTIGFTRPPGSTASWGGITINGEGDSPETRMTWASFEGNGKTCITVAGGALYLDHATFLTTLYRYVSLTGASFVLSHCHFPTPTASFEPVKGSGGIKAGGHGILQHCFLGKTTGHNDALGFSGGNRELDQPILQLYNNVFIGSGDDLMDIDGTDVWIEGNIFMHCHRNGSPDSSSAVSGGSGNGHTANVTLLGNLFFDCDNAATAKEGNFYTLLNNTIVHTTKAGGQDTLSGVVCIRDNTPSLSTFGKGAYLEGNIIVDAEQLVRNYDAKQATVTWKNNILPMAWSGPGNGNTVIDPLLKHIPEVAEADFSTWDEAQVMREWFSLQSRSPARGAGPNGTDMGGVIPLGVSIAGEPIGTTCKTDATLTVGVNRTGSGIPATTFPLGSGFTHYRWRLDGGAWSAETSIATAIKLTNLAQGQHHVDVIGRNDAGLYQNDALLGTDGVVTASRMWAVDRTHSRVQINEVLAPGLIELYYDGPSTRDLSGMRITNDATRPTKFVFPSGTKMTPGQYLVLFADANTAPSGIHLGFSLARDGDEAYLYDKSGTLVDSVEFGRQLADLSIGRVGYENQWTLTVPTPGQANLSVPLADPDLTVINEWLAVGTGNFIELYNPGTDPVDMAGMYLTDGAATVAAASRVRSLSFVDAGSYAVFLADKSTAAGHVNFRLVSTGGTIRLFNGQAREIDKIAYGRQTTGVSQGRTPDGADKLEFFPVPTPGAANPGAKKTVKVNRVLVTEDADKRVLVPTASIGDDWKGGSAFSDAEWMPCAGAPGGVGYDREDDYNPLITLDVEARMYGTGKNNTCYVRVPFALDATAVADVNELTLKVRYDDGFVAYLNGTEVARRNVAGTPAWNSKADSSIESDGDTFDESIDLSSFIDDLKAGTNVLAIHAVNSGSSSSDFLISVALDAVLVTVK